MEQKKPEFNVIGESQSPKGNGGNGGKPEEPKPTIHMVIEYKNGEVFLGGVLPADHTLALGMLAQAELRLNQFYFMKKKQEQNEKPVIVSPGQVNNQVASRSWLNKILKGG
jgi:hypothetical protein